MSLSCFCFDFEVSAESCQEAIPSPAQNVSSKYMTLQKWHYVSNQHSFEWFCPVLLFVRRHVRIHSIHSSKYLDTFRTARLVCAVLQTSLLVVLWVFKVNSLTSAAGEAGAARTRPLIADFSLGAVA